MTGVARHIGIGLLACALSSGAVVAQGWQHIGKVQHLEKLKDGASVAFLAQLSLSPEVNAPAIKRAVERNPSSAVAAAGILRAEGLLAEARSASRLQVNGNVVTTTLNRGVEFSGGREELKQTEIARRRRQSLTSGLLRCPEFSAAIVAKGCTSEVGQFHPVLVFACWHTA